MNKEELKKLQLELNSVNDKFNLPQYKIDRIENIVKYASYAGKQCKIQKKGIHAFDSEKRKKQASIAGKIRGKLVGKGNVESGHWAKCHQLAKEACYIAILQCDKKTGKVIKEWKGATVAADELGLSNKAINNNLKGLSKSCGGFIWKYKK